MRRNLPLSANGANAWGEWSELCAACNAMLKQWLAAPRLRPPYSDDDDCAVGTVR